MPFFTCHCCWLVYLYLSSSFAEYMYIYAWVFAPLRSAGMVVSFNKLFLCRQIYTANGTYTIACFGTAFNTLCHINRFADYSYVVHNVPCNYINIQPIPVPEIRQIVIHMEQFQNFTSTEKTTRINFLSKIEVKNTHLCSVLYTVQIRHSYLQTPWCRCRYRSRKNNRTTEKKRTNDVSRKNRSARGKWFLCAIDNQWMFQEWLWNWIRARKKYIYSNQQMMVLFAFCENKNYLFLVDIVRSTV